MGDETRDVLAELREHKWQKKAAKQIESGSRQIESLQAKTKLQAERIEELEGSIALLNVKAECAAMSEGRCRTEILGLKQENATLREALKP